MTTDTEDCSFTWKVPSINEHEKNLICTWYGRINCNGIVGKDIISTMIQFLSPNESWSLADLKHARLRRQFVSPIFILHGINFCLEFKTQDEPGFTGLFLSIAVFSPNIEKIILQFQLSCLETNTHWECATETFIWRDSSWGWREPFLPTSSIQHLNRITFKVKIALLCVYSKLGNNITKHYMNKCESVDFIDKQKDMISNSQLMEISAQIKEIMKNINEVKDTVQSIQIELNTEKQEGHRLHVSQVSSKQNDNEQFKNWVENILKLPEYYDVFIQHGIENLNIMKLITIKELDVIGINKIGHRIQLLYEIDKLKHLEAVQ